MSKFLPISKSKYRTVISDVLPYERPVFFTNRFFARFLKYYGVKTDNGVLVATRHTDEEGLDDFLMLLGGRKDVERPCFQYSISKDNESEGRQLSVIHPYHQVKMVEFYDCYKELLVEFCHHSNFSIRFPHKVAVWQKKQKGYHKLFSDDAEELDTQESLKHFFAYRYYRNINYFYDDYRFLRAEKKFSHLVKIDLEHCFESIHPESLTKAIFGKKQEDCQGSFAYEFCELQQSFGNKSEGIVIGPEFSRIYAEMILQQIDQAVEIELKKLGFERNKDYIFYRYVDDGFLYYSSDFTKDIFFLAYESLLNPYNLKINKEKTISFNIRPFIEPISMVKARFSQLVDKKFQNRLETFKGFKKVQANLYDTPTKVNAKAFIMEIRNIMRSCGESVKYKDVTSSLLGIIQKKLMYLLEDFNRLYSQYSKAAANEEINDQGSAIKEKYEREFIIFCKELVEILFYILQCDLRMSTSIKVVSIVNKLQIFIRGKYKIDEYEMSDKFPNELICKLDEKISDEIGILFRNTVPTRYNLMEVLNILEVEKIMSPQNQISPVILCNFLNRLNDMAECLNFFTVFELIHYIRRSKGYDELNLHLHAWIAKKLESLKDFQYSDTEAVITLLETLCCPWIEEDRKNQYVKMVSDDHTNKIYSFAKRQKNLFVSWHKYNLNEALVYVNSAEVY